MRWSDKGWMVATDIQEAATLHMSVKLTCKCGNSASFDSHGLWWRFTCKRWDMRLGEARRRFFCSRCWAKAYQKVRPAKLELVGWAETDVMLPRPDEREWKRAMRRVR